jgi:hypothetical protein
MVKYSDKFHIRKDFKVSLEGKVDPETNRSEEDTLEQISNSSGYTKARILRMSFLEYAEKNKCLLSKSPMIDNYVDNNGTKEFEKLECPSLLDNREKFIEYYKGSDEKERMKIRISLNDWGKIIDMVELNEGRKIGRMSR